MIGFEATFQVLQPDMARALESVAAASLVEVPEAAMTCGNQFRSASWQAAIEPTYSTTDSTVSVDIRVCSWLVTIEPILRILNF